MPLFAGAALVLVVTLVYIPVFDAGTLWDDAEFLSDNALLRSVPGLIRIWASPLDSPQYYPVLLTSFWLEYHLWGLNYTGYHVVNVLLHGLNAVLVWRVLRRLDVPGAWVAAAIFGLHPVHVESVAWITERKNLLSGLFYLWALLVYFRFSPPDPEPAPSASGETAGTESAGERRLRVARRCAQYLLALFLYVAALGSKTVAASLPAVILLIVWWKRDKITLRDVLPLVPFFAVGIWAGALTAWIETYFVGARGAEFSFSPLERTLIAGRALWFYAGKLLWPARLMLVYPRWRIDVSASEWYGYLLGVFAVIAALWVTRRWIGRGPLTGVLFFCGSLVPALGFFNIGYFRLSFVADHFQYLPSLGLIVVATALGVRVLDALRVPTWGRAAVAAAVLGTFGALTLTRAPAFSNPQMIWQDTLDKDPTSWAANCGVGQFYRNRYEFAKARPYFETALKHKPDCIDAQYCLAAVLEFQGDLEGAERLLKHVLSVHPDYWDAHFVLGLVRKKQGRLAEAAQEFRTTVRLRPYSEEARKELDRVERGPASGIHPTFDGESAQTHR